MLPRLLWVLPLVFAIALPLGAADEKKDKDQDDKAEKTDKSEKPEKSESMKDGKAEAPHKKKDDHYLVGSLGGTIKSITGDQMVITVKYPDTKANQATLQKGMQQAVQQAQRAMRSGNRRGGGYRGRGRGRSNPMQQMMRQMMQMQRGMFALEMGEIRAIQNLQKNFKYKTQDVDLTLSSKVLVRVPKPPVEFDDKGNIKKHTRAELLELKGEVKTAWGYPSETSELRNGQYVAVYVYKKRKPRTTVATTANKDKEADKDKEKEEDADDDDADGEGAKVRRVYILSGAGSGQGQVAAKPSPGNGNGNRKKK